MSYYQRLIVKDLSVHRIFSLAEKQMQELHYVCL